MKKFDFKHSEFEKNCEAKQQYLIKVHGHSVTEAEFVEAINNMPKHVHWSKTHSPSKARYDYKRLKQNYGFFS
jgi:hypothetical protein